MVFMPFLAMGKREMNRIIFRLLCVLACTVVIALFAPGPSQAEIAAKSYVDTKADKVETPVAGHMAAVDANGNLTDSGKSAVDFATSAQGAKADAALPLSGGTMTGEIEMGGSKITGLGAPTETTDGVTKKYVDDIAAQSAGGLNGNSPSWAALNSASWASPHWGDIWEVVSADGATKVEGVAACLGNNSNNEVTDKDNPLSNKLPPWSGWGQNCYCRVSRVNDERVVGAWVFYNTRGTNNDCYSTCAANCSSCVRLGTLHSCSRSSLFAAP
jgi:hypothetical protein